MATLHTLLRAPNAQTALKCLCVDYQYQMLRFKYTAAQRKIDLDHMFAPEVREPYLIKSYGETLPRPMPFPYEKKWYGFFDKLFDKTIWRLDRNSKVIIVEGNIASGKTEVAKRLAHDFSMKYIPSPKSDDIFIMPDGFDLRDLNPMLPRRIQHYDLKMFYSDPDPMKGMIGLTQFNMFRLRLFRYADAMLHLLSTGQGVVIERAVQADIIFPHILEKFGLLSSAGLAHYWDLYKQCLVEFLQPHLTVYLDSPVSQVREGIIKRNIPHEVNSKVITDEYLEAYNYFAKEVFLPEVSRTGETLIVDTSNGLNLEDIVEDVGNLDLETKDLDHYTKFDMWTFASEHELSFYRHQAQDRQYQERLTAIQPMWDAPELMFTSEENVIYEKVAVEHPRIKYKKGYEPDQVPSWKLMFMRP